MPCTMSRMLSCIPCVKKSPVASQKTTKPRAMIKVMELPRKMTANEVTFSNIVSVCLYIFRMFFLIIVMRVG